MTDAFRRILYIKFYIYTLFILILISFYRIRMFIKPIKNYLSKTWLSDSTQIRRYGQYNSSLMTLSLHIFLECSACGNISKRLFLRHFRIWLLILDYSADTPIGFCLYDMMCCKKTIGKRPQSTPPVCCWAGKKVTWMILSG